jgi:hypothetical protein
MALEQIPTQPTHDERGPDAFSVELMVNGELHVLEIEPRVTLLMRSAALDRRGVGPPAADGDRAADGRPLGE